ncbi:hemerythrin domain-containing protein [Geodermatophilus sp. CPCC 205506]|uniref:hemerythrin domain-containing protein n=1 Tax=Geodermatophilus sp. CPCC 205506 TaxID=2936596 RepID=UPI003EEBBD6E
MTATASVDQLLLPGQAAAPDGPIDLAAMYLMHRAFRRDLDAFTRVTADVPVADRRRWRLVARRFGLFASVLHKHHTGEDAGLWPLLAERGADRAVLDALEEEHAVVDPLLAACRTHLTALARGQAGEDARRALTDRTAELRDALCAHLAHEERDGMALVQAHLTQEDWDRLDREVFAKEYRPHEIPAVLGWVVSGLTDEQVRRLPGATPLLIRAGRLMARRLERRDARVFGAAPGRTTA